MRDLRSPKFHSRAPHDDDGLADAHTPNTAAGEHKTNLLTLSNSQLERCRVEAGDGGGRVNGTARLDVVSGVFCQGEGGNGYLSSHPRAFA